MTLAPEVLLRHRDDFLMTGSPTGQLSGLFKDTPNTSTLHDPHC